MSEERDYEKEALAEGWNPEFDGPGKKDAKTFVEDGEKINGLLKGKIGRLEERIDSLTETNAEFKKYTDAQIKREQEKNQSLIRDLEKAKAQAITDGDGAAAVQAEKDIQALESQELPSNNGYNELAQNWAAENKWYATNEKLGAFADGIADRIISEGYQGQAYFNELTRRTKDAFPEEFENPNRQRANTVEDVGGKGGSSKEHTWANLPAADKAVANRFISDMPGFTKEQFLAQYEWEEE
jgi:hypothetical protein